MAVCAERDEKHASQSESDESERGSRHLAHSGGKRISSKIFFVFVKSEANIV